MKKTVFPSILKGQVKIPGDKSISHRALMFASIASGKSTIDNLLEGHDVIATLQVMRALGVHIALENNSWIIHGHGPNLTEPSSPLDCKNSGTTIRLMAGLLSGMPFMSILDGTDQIKTRPMDRVIEPLSSIGAKIFGRKNQLAPLVILPSSITGGHIALSIKSAQVKSALLLAGLFAKNPVHITGTEATRDHTEKMLSFMGANISCQKDLVSIEPLEKPLSPINIRIPGDISSAAFLLVAGAVLSTDG